MKEEYYQNSLEHVIHELSLIDLYLACVVSSFRNSTEKQDWNDFSGLYVSDKEIDDSVGRKITSTTADCPQRIQEAICQSEQKIREKTDASLKKGIDLNLIHLSKRLRLSKLEHRIILICLAPEVDSKYERIYAYLHNDVTKKRPTMGLILNLLCRSIDEKVKSRRFFTQTSKLFKYRILEFGRSEYGGELTHVLTTPILIDEHITSFLLGHTEIDSRIEAFARLSYTDRNKYTEKHGQFAYEYLKEKVSAVIKTRRYYQKDKIIFYFSGPTGAGKKTLAEKLCDDFGLGLLKADLRRAAIYMKDFENAIGLVFREALLQNAVLFLDNFDDLSIDRFVNGHEVDNSNNNKVSKDSNRLIEIVLRNIECTPQQIIILAGKNEFISRSVEELIHPITINFPELSQVIRKKIWEELLQDCVLADKIDTDDLSTKFRFTPGQIKNTVLNATQAALLKSSKENIPNVSSSDLYEACHLQSSKRLSTLARHISLKHTLDDIILPTDKKSQLEEILSYVQYKNTIYHDWGFEEKLSLGKGLNILFAGESGTGKTMAAEIIANELKLDLYRINLSSLVSKYIGETEKNMDRIFREAEASNTILFFDEADAIFGKRSEVKDAHDRYANIEISYLLQKLEEHKEIVILASNLAKNIDDAFVRRMQFWIEFPFPDEQSRRMIWKNIYPRVAPLDTNTIDFEFLSKQFSVSGGVIKNIAVASAFLAKQSGSNIISMEHIIKAIRREYNKMGKPCLKAEFGKYYEMIAENEPHK